MVRNGLVRPGAARAARASAAATAADLLPPEVDRGRRFAARHREARNQHPGLGRLAGRADLGAVPLREPGKDFELPGAALAPILVDGYLMNVSKPDTLAGLSRCELGRAETKAARAPDRSASRDARGPERKCQRTYRSHPARGCSHGSGDPGSARSARAIDLGVAGTHVAA